MAHAKLPFPVSVRRQAAAALLICACAGTVFAQTAERPSRGIFGGPGAAPDARQTLDVTVSLAEAYDDDALADLRGGGAQPALNRDAGYFTMLLADGAYQRRGRNVQFRATGGSAFYYYNDLGEARSVSHTVGAGLSGRMSRGLSFVVNQTAAYSPSYLYGLFPGDATLEPGEAIPAAPDYAVDGLGSYSYGTSGRLTHEFRRGPRLSAIGSVQQTDYTSETAGLRDRGTRTLGADFSHGLKRNLAMTGGYQFRTGDFGYAAEGTTQEHRATAGFDFTPRLSATRQPRFGFNIGMSLVDIPRGAGSLLSGRKYDVDADMTILYPFARTWSARAAYRRGLEHMEALAEPVYVNGASGSVEGLVTRRVDFRATASYASGENALNRTGRIFDTYQGSARLRYGMTRALAVYGEYLYYYYDFRVDAQRAPGIPSGLERNGVRAGLTLQLSPLRR